MKQNHLFNIGALIIALVLSGFMTGCMEKDVYDPNYNKNPLPAPEEYFDFEMRSDVKLSVNYNISGFTPLIEIYGENPMEISEGTLAKKEGIEALFKIYADNNGKYEGKMNIPTSIDKVYLYTETWGLPRCVELEVKDNAVSFDMSAKLNSRQKSVTRASLTGVPYPVNYSQNLYSLSKWEEGGILSNTYLSVEKNVGSESVVELADRMRKFFAIGGQDNSHLLRDPQTINISIKEDNTALDVIFLNRDAQFNNTFGYYFYKTETSVDVDKIRKYIVFPNVTYYAYEGKYGQVLECGSKVRLLYFDENGNASETFPKGYTVGWFIYAEGFNSNYYEDNLEGYINVSKLLTSNPKFNMPSFVSVKDEKSGKTILGAEDGPNKSYCDLLFYVNASPETSIDDTGRPTIPDEGKDDPEKPDEIETISGTLAYEDIWPTGGDYDMNDVVIEYSHETYFNQKNMVTKIIDTFKPVHDGAKYKNAFAYQIDGGYIGSLATLPDGVIYEKETSSIIVFPNAKAVQGQSYQITREFNGTFTKDELSSHPYNPYIIVNYVEGQTNRTEVHLPKHKVTSMADQDKIGTEDDAYYIDREGAYPFAIDIPILKFTIVTEKYGIDREYPEFSKWANSKGANYKDWYMKYQKDKLTGK